MKSLYVTSRSLDHLSVMIWDGLQEVLGEENVVDAVGCPWLHESGVSEAMADSCPPLARIARCRTGRTWLFGERFDLLVVNACFNRDHDWNWLRTWYGSLHPWAKVAYVEGWDAAWQAETPQTRVDAVFRKEILPGYPYPYHPHHLTFALPERIFEDAPVGDEDRPYDLMFVGNPDTGHPSDLGMRWRMLRETFNSRRRHRSVVATRNMGYQRFRELLRRTKFCLCPAAADNADSLRTYEAASAGAIPVFVNYPDYRREEWFTGEHAIFCSTETLADHIDEALSHDNTDKRRALLDHARRHHTTRARSEKALRILGLDPEGP